jgi:hypothetical protein
MNLASAAPAGATGCTQNHYNYIIQRLQLGTESLALQILAEFINNSSTTSVCYSLRGHASCSRPNKLLEFRSRVKGGTRGQANLLAEASFGPATTVTRCDESVNRRTEDTDLAGRSRARARELVGLSILFLRYEAVVMCLADDEVETYQYRSNWPTPCFITKETFTKGTGANTNTIRHFRHS